MACAAQEDKRILLHPGANPEKKASDSVITNPYVLYIAFHYNDSLRKLANLALCECLSNIIEKGACCCWFT